MATNLGCKWMSFNEQMSEVAGILAAGVVRMRRRQMKKTASGQCFSGFGLDLSGKESVHSTNTLPEGESR